MASLALPFNTTSINANFPVGHGLINAIAVMAFVVFTYIFVGTTLLTLYKGQNAKWASVAAFKGIDIGMGSLVWAGAVFTIFIDGILQYREQLKLALYAGVGSIYNPQDVSNIVEASVCLSMLILWKIALFVDSAGGATIEGVVKSTPAYRKAKYFFNLFTGFTLLFLCLWPAAFGFLQQYQHYSLYPYTNQDGWFGPASTYTAVGAGNLATGIILAFSIVWYYSAGKLVKMYLKFSNKGVQTNTFDVLMDAPVSYQSKLFAGVEGFNTAAVVKGWIPTYHLPTSFVIAFIFFTGSSNMFTKYDLIKTTEFFFCVCMVPLFLCAVAQSLDYFLAYHVAARFWFISFQYFAGAVLTTYLNLTPGAGPQSAVGLNLDFGMYLSGPGNDTSSGGLIDPTTVKFQTWFALSLTIISFCFSIWGGEKNKA